MKLTKHGANIYGEVRRQRGASMFEYTILVALVAVICVGAVHSIGLNLKTSLVASYTKIEADGQYTPPCDVGSPTYPGCLVGP